MILLLFIIAWSNLENTCILRFQIFIYHVPSFSQPKIRWRSLSDLLTQLQFLFNQFQQRLLQSWDTTYYIFVLEIFQLQISWFFLAFQLTLLLNVSNERKHREMKEDLPIRTHLTCVCSSPKFPRSKLVRGIFRNSTSTD